MRKVVKEQCIESRGEEFSTEGKEKGWGQKQKQKRKIENVAEKRRKVESLLSVVICPFERNNR